MKRIFPALVLALLITGVATAQQRRATVNGVVADADTRQSLIGVVVELIPASDSTKATVIVSGAGGAFSTGLNREEHEVRASMMGYETLRRRENISEARQTLDTLFLRQGIMIDAVVLNAVAMRTSMAGDTLIYNADSYRVASDATVSGLLEKMPGIRVDGGTVEAHGEAVQRILIDNREFFGSDVTAAIAALPAEAVKSIEVFDKLSDNAEFTGIDDGEGYKAINITTRESMRQGVMGQVSALYGVEPPETGVKGGDGEPWHHYGLAGGNVSIFNGDAKITLGGTLNNLNERHFTSDDILGAGDDDGIANVGRLQFNYIDVLGKRDQWNVDASYSYDVTDSEASTRIDREYFDTDDALYKNYYSTANRNVLNVRQSFRGRIDWKPNENHELRIRPTLNYQGGNSDRSSLETYIPADGSDNIYLNSWSNSDESGYLAQLSANYRVKLGKPGRTLSLFSNISYDPDDHPGNESYSERQEMMPDGGHVYVRQSNPEYAVDFNVNGSVTYTEPISESSLLNFDYRVGYSYSDQDGKAYLWDELLGEYDYSAPDPELSGVYNSRYITHRVGPGYRMQKGNTTLSAGLSYQFSTLESTRVLPHEYELAHNFGNLTYSAMLNTQFESGASIRMFLNSRTRNPGVTDLQDVVNISNVQNIRKGNLNLKPSYGHSLYGRFIIPNVQKGRTLAINLGGNYTTNAIVRRIVRESPGYQITDSEGNVVETLDAVGSYSEPVNMDGQWSGRFGVDYGFPVKFLSSNLNLEAEVDYGESPSQLGKWSPGMTEPLYQTNLQRNLGTEAGITLGSNISERVDFRIGYEFGYNRVRNTLFSGSDNEFIEHDIDLDFKFVLPADFTITGNLNYDFNKSLSGQDFKQEFLIANAGIGKKVLRSRQGEVSIFVNDILNQNISFRRRAEAQFIQNQIDQAIGRYIGVKFTWNIRFFGNGASRNMQMYDTGGGGDNHRGGRGGRGFGGGRGF